MSHVHLCIITGQPIANLIPLLQERPEFIALMHTDSKKNEAEQFIRTLERAGFDKKNISVFGEMPENNFAQISDYALEIYAKLEERYPEANITFNATGGTKQMVLAVWESLTGATDRVIYCNTRDAHIEQLKPQAQSIPLQHVLTDSELYLHAFGKIQRKLESSDPQWASAADKRKKATRYLGENTEKLAGLVQKFNRLQNDTANLQKLQFDFLNRDWQAAIELLLQADVLSYDEEEQCYLAQHVRYLTGGWLEEYVWLIANNQRVDFAGCGLVFDDFQQRKKNETNEIDAFILHHNRLLLIECKSGAMGREAVKDSQIIYKLDSIGQHAGGVEATRVLVSAQELEHTTASGHDVNTQARATASGIKTLAAAQLKELGNCIKYWQEHGKWPEQSKR